MATDEIILDELETKYEQFSVRNERTDENEDTQNNDEYPIMEHFHEVDGGAALSDGGLLAKYCFRTLKKYPIIYGYKRYSYGTHRIDFQIDKRGDLRYFFGIIASSDSVCRNMTTEIDNKSLYGWWGLNASVINGKVKRSKSNNEVEKFDKLSLVLKCDQHKIELEHCRTKQILQLPIDIAHCPFPWKIVVELTSYGDCIRIIQ